MINSAATRHLQACDFRCVARGVLYTTHQFFGPPITSCSIKGRIPEERGVYVILTEEAVLYVGSSGIGKGNPSKRLKTHRTSERTHQGILALLTAGHSVEVWVCTGEDQIVTTRSGREIDGFLAIEQDLIAHFQPPWNVIGTTRSHPGFSEGARKAHKTRRARKAMRPRHEPVKGEAAPASIKWPPGVVDQTSERSGETLTIIGMPRPEAAAKDLPP